MKVCLFWKYPTVWPLPHGIGAELGPVPSPPAPRLSHTQQPDCDFGLTWICSSFSTTLLSHLWWVRLDRHRCEGVRGKWMPTIYFYGGWWGIESNKKWKKCDLVPNPFPFAGWIWIANETETEGLLMTMCERNNSPDQEEIFIDLWLWLFGLMLWPQIMIYFGSKDTLRVLSARTTAWGRREMPLISRICIFQFFFTLCLNDHRYRISLKVKVFKWFLSFFLSKRIAIKGLWIHLTLFSSLPWNVRNVENREEKNEMGFFALLTLYCLPLDVTNSWLEISEGCNPTFPRLPV